MCVGVRESLNLILGVFLHCSPLYLQGKITRAWTPELSCSASLASQLASQVLGLWAPPRLPCFYVGSRDLKSGHSSCKASVC